MSKPKVLLAILTGIERHNWVNPELSVNLFNMARDPRFDVVYYPVFDARPWEAARNLTILAAKQVNADWLLSLDNDNFFGPRPHTPLDVIAAAKENQHVIGLTCGVGCPDSYALFPETRAGKADGAFREVDYVGGATLIVRKTVWQEIPQGPWFRWHHAPNNEVLSPSKGACGEDVYFCQLVRQHGFKVWTHREQLAGHYRTTDITGMVHTMAQLTEAAK